MEVDLFDPSAAEGPRPAWRVIEAARRRYLTGLLVLDTAPTTNVWLRDGQVYFAERTTDGGLAVRLLVEGVLTRAQMQAATIQVSGVEHLGRMFERDATIDRDAVELCIELMTDDVLTSIADAPVEQWTMKMYQRHPSGIDRWLPTRVEVITHLVESPATADPEVTVSAAPAPVRPRAQLTPPPPAVTGEVPTVAVIDAAPAADTATIDIAPGEPASVAPASVAPASVDTVEHAEAGEVVDTAAAPAAFEAALVVHEDLPPEPPAPAPAPVTFAPIPAPFGSPVSTEVPVVVAAAAADATPVEEEPLAGLAPSAMEALMSGSIKDEVAEAVRRALASIEP